MIERIMPGATHIFDGQNQGFKSTSQIRMCPKIVVTQTLAVLL